MGTAMYLPLQILAQAVGPGVSPAETMRSHIGSAIITICGIASLACVFFLMVGGMQYITCTGQPEKMDRAKRILKNALIGLTMVLAAGSITAILHHSYQSSGQAPAEKFPTLQTVETKKDKNGFKEAIIKTVVEFLRGIIESAAEPFLKALGYFTNSTPLMANNSNVFNLWLAVVGIADVLFILVVALMGFHVMSAATLGLDEIDVRHLLPQFVIIFLLINVSIFAIDAVISLCNGMIYALRSGFSSIDIWQVLINITKKSSDMGLAGLLVMLAFLILVVMLLVYYVLRLITLYLGTILSPLVILLWLIPAFKDFAVTALKTFLMTIFVLFVHAVILLLAGSMFSDMLRGSNVDQPNALMALIVGLAALVALLKAQGVMQELSYAASGPRAARELSSSFIRGVSHMTHSVKSVKRGVDSTKKAAKKSMVTGGRVASHLSSAVKRNPSSPTLNSPESRSKSPGTVIRSRPLRTGETRPANKRHKKTDT